MAANGLAIGRRLIRVSDLHPMTGSLDRSSDQSGDIYSPDWIVFDPKKMEAKIGGVPRFDTADTTYNLTSVIEFYSR